jgi:hypothetical protein
LVTPTTECRNLLDLSSNATISSCPPSCVVAMAGQDDKWRGSVTEIIPAPIEKVWAYLSDFKALKTNYSEAFISCETVEGEVNKVGSVRFVVCPFGDGIIEVNERLLHQDEVNHTLSYGMEKNSMGWKGYTGHVSAKTGENGQTIAEWGYSLDPIGGMTHEEYDAAGPKTLFSTLLRILKEKF